ncbi:MAG: hypothetical protein IPJ00_11035 [Saprospirales bacterium]|nr:hypothetical protein [Saprospirales bacterium]
MWRNDTLRFQYKLTDHLGNTVVFFEDMDLNTEILTEEMTGDTLLLEVLQRNYYYPVMKWKTLGFTDRAGDEVFV